jgi:hypothetical protein
VGCGGCGGEHGTGLALKGSWLWFWSPWLFWLGKGQLGAPAALRGLEWSAQVKGFGRAESSTLVVGVAGGREG